MSMALSMASDSNLVESGFTPQHLSAMVESMPPFPDSVHQVMAMTSNLNCSPKGLVGVIERDPVLTMKILKMVNSAFFALSREVASVQHALVYLGMNTVKNMAVAIATVDTLPRNSIPELPMSSFLTHSLATAAIAQKLAKDYLQLRDASDHFVAGLLHDFGKVVFLQFEPVTYAKILKEARQNGRPLADVEMKYTGISSAALGSMLAESWQLPQELVDCIRMHADCNEQSSDLVLSVAVANTMAKAMGLGDSGNPVVGEFEGFMSRRLGHDLETMIEQMHDLPTDIQLIQGVVHG